MATTDQYLACLGEEIVILEDKNIIDRIILDEEIVHESIDKTIEEGTIAPSLVFKNAIERILGIKFFNPRRVLVIDGKKVSIHDQPVYKKYYPYIMDNERLKRQRNNAKDRRNARNEYYKKNKQVENFFIEHKNKIYKRAIKNQIIKR